MFPGKGIYIISMYHEGCGGGGYEDSYRDYGEDEEQDDGGYYEEQQEYVGDDPDDVADVH